MTRVPPIKSLVCKKYRYKAFSLLHRMNFLQRSDILKWSSLENLSFKSSQGSMTLSI